MKQIKERWRQNILEDLKLWGRYVENEDQNYMLTRYGITYRSKHTYDLVEKILKNEWNDELNCVEINLEGE